MTAQWQENYNIHTLHLAGLLTLTCAWNSSASRDAPHGYVVSVNSRRLTRLFPDIPSAKHAAIGFARRIVDEMKTALMEVEE